MTLSEAKKRITYLDERNADVARVYAKGVNARDALITALKDEVQFLKAEAVALRLELSNKRVCIGELLAAKYPRKGAA